MAPAQCNLPCANSNMSRSDSTRLQAPIKPGELVVLTPCVVITALGPPDFVAGQQHRDPSTDHQDRDEVLCLTATEDGHGRVISIAFKPAVQSQTTNRKSNYRSGNVDRGLGGLKSAKSLARQKHTLKKICTRTPGKHQAEEAPEHECERDGALGPCGKLSEQRPHHHGRSVSHEDRG